MFDKTAYSVQMNFKVPESEKEIAERAEKYFEKLITKMKDIEDYLNIIYIPFKKYQDADPEMLVEYRRTFRQYRDACKSKFRNIVKMSYKAVALMNEFSTDTATEELMDSFVGSIRELEKYVDTYVGIFGNLSSPEFQTHLVSTIDSIKKQFSQIKQLIIDRIISHIDNNILAKDWAKDVLDRFDDTNQERVPLVVELFRERQRAISGK